MDVIPNTILDCITNHNPDVTQRTLRDREGRKNTSNNDWHMPEYLREWKEFNLEGLKSLYEGALYNALATTPASFSEPNIITDVDLVVNDEMGVVNIYTKWNSSIVNQALLNLGSDFHPAIWTPGVWERRSETDQSGVLPKSRPDAGAVVLCSNCEPLKVYIERLPKDYKMAQKWRSSKVIAALDENGTMDETQRVVLSNDMMPIRQVFTYCIERSCRYGCILTTEEAFVFRIRPEHETMNAVEQAIIDDGLMEYKSIPWCSDAKRAAQGEIQSINLALTFLHVLAGNEYHVEMSYQTLALEPRKSSTCVPEVRDINLRHRSVDLIRAPSSNRGQRRRSASKEFMPSSPLRQIAGSNTAILPETNIATSRKKRSREHTDSRSVSSRSEKSDRTIKKAKT